MVFSVVHTPSQLSIIQVVDRDSNEHKYINLKCHFIMKLSPPSLNNIGLRKVCIMKLAFAKLDSMDGSNRVLMP
ncbi:hypothetical protein VNO77_01924 [Canavalia gladiata]|uniref:Uncharacterized protein n=1 Tax=Canavalia gladiata TaxID=3824 RepID=A0AAN9MS44_CANGL